MRMKIQFTLILIMSVFIAGCATGSLKAPCDAQAHFCGTKTKINHW